MAPMYYRDALGAVLVYDVTFKESFTKVENDSSQFLCRKVEKWIEELREFASKSIEIVIAGNKCDMKNHMQISL